MHALPLPGRLPKHQDYRVMKLPSDVSKAAVYRNYCKALQALQIEGELVRIVSYQQFCRLWQEIVPFVTTMKPSSDLCLICQENVATIMRSCNLSDDEKSTHLKVAEEHLRCAKKEASKLAWNNLPPDSRRHGNPPCSIPTTMLYSLDHAQLVYIPANPLQPGPAYFKTA